MFTAFTELLKSTKGVKKIVVSKETMTELLTCKVSGKNEKDNNVDSFIFHSDFGEVEITTKEK